MKGRKGMRWGVPRRVVAALAAAPEHERPTATNLDGGGVAYHGAPKRKKDTLRWCKGKPGREHKPAWVPFDVSTDAGSPANWRVLVCSACKKEIGWDYPFGTPRKLCGKPCDFFYLVGQRYPLRPAYQRIEKGRIIRQRTVDGLANTIVTSDKIHPPEAPRPSLCTLGAEHKGPCDPKP
jgi:hypothetical protein